jgi:hypothetical protein
VQHHTLFEIGIQIHRTHLTHHIKGNGRAQRAGMGYTSYVRHRLAATTARPRARRRGLDWKGCDWVMRDLQALRRLLESAKQA